MAGQSFHGSVSSDHDMRFIVNKRSDGDVSAHLEVLRGLKNAIIADADTACLKRLLEKCDGADIEGWQDDSGFDLMHYCIMANNHEAVLLLFTRDLFRPPHHPIVPYLHLACELGLRTVCGFIMDFRTDDDVAVVYEHADLPLPVKIGNQKSSDNFNFSGSTTSSKHNRTTPCRLRPIDIAASLGHLNCVRFLLDRYDRQIHSPKSPPLTHLSLATKLGSSLTVKLLLQSDKWSERDILSAVDIAIREIRPKCLDVLLSEKPDTSLLFSGMNLFHVLYQYPLAFDQDRLDGYPETTDVLIKHGYNVNANTPSRTYPLFSLLSRHALYSNAKDADTKVLKACLGSLLRSGADPNFDEAQAEKEDQRGAYGRDAYPSALFCLYHTVYSVAKTLSESEKASFNLSALMCDCSELLLQHGANARKVARVYHLFGDGLHSNMTVLHEWARCSSLTGAYLPLLRLLLHHGADPMAKFKGMFFITTYCLGKQLHKDPQKVYCPLFDKAICDTCLRALVSTCERQSLASVYKYVVNLDSVLPDAKISQDVQNGLGLYLTKVRSLKQECMAVIWEICRQNYNSVYSLPLPRELQKTIVPSLDLE